MLGYVRPFRDELKCGEFDRYQAAYCGLCRTLGKRYGFRARLFLNYDFTFLVMLLMGDGGTWETEFHSCPTQPFRRRCMLLHHNGIELAADETVILTYWKLKDDVSDHSFVRGLPYRFCAALLRRSYRKAAALQPEFDRVVRQALEELGELERGCSGSLDRTADTFARILKAASPHTGRPDRDRAMEQLLYHVGRWIYLVDARNDLEEDLRSGAYNPLRYRFPEGEDFQPYLRTSLKHSLNLAISAFGLLDDSAFTPIVENILYFGLPMVEEAVFSGTWRTLQKQISRR